LTAFVGLFVQAVSSPVLLIFNRYLDKNSYREFLLKDNAGSADMKTTVNSVYSEKESQESGRRAEQPETCPLSTHDLLSD
jgi:hypothetical protein